MAENDILKQHIEEIILASSGTKDKKLVVVVKDEEGQGNKNETQTDYDNNNNNNNNNIPIAAIIATDCTIITQQEPRTDYVTQIENYTRNCEWQ